MDKTALIVHFEKFVPSEFSEYCADLLLEYKVLLTVTKPRNSKNGDYRPPLRGKKQHKVSVNGNLNPYFFLLVYIHEMAHVKTWEQFKNQANPHGMEWKNNFRLMTEPVIQSQKLPNDLHAALLRFFIKTPATFLADTHLTKVLRRYDKDYDPNEALTLDHIPMGSKFKLQNGLTFVKNEKLRTWYLCKELRSGKTYRVKGNAEVEIMNIDI